MIYPFKRENFKIYDPEPSTTDELEQHLTISANERVWFIGYNYAGGFGKYRISRKQ
ncbi:hypothetical protein [Clostridium aquiflavi]|uniref:Uncharacterized protein n=1 Tax=Clostridium aquiflavi TaxID=3073603 RepID=A0ABU1ECF0_9CLOT|nr:hypothetical protein [Clostridium sp. 5N-1]MDR5586055.1 hypothetical protein [Clostridium sp. 5N-1]